MSLLFNSQESKLTLCISVEVNKISKDMDELDDLFNKFEEKSSSLNERLEQLLAMDETTNSALAQLAGDLGNLQLTGTSDIEALTAQIDRLQGNNESSASPSSSSNRPSSSSGSDDQFYS